MVSRILCSLAVVILLPSVTLANGLLYQLPEDGTWVSFKMDGKGTQPDGSKVTYVGSLTLSSVGTVEVDGQKCRWIEMVNEAERNGNSFTMIEKLLIPEKHLGKGKEPLKHVQKAWRKHSEVDEEPREIKDLERAFVQEYRLELHGPFRSVQELEAVTIDTDTKLGKLKCKGIRTSEQFDQSGVTMNATYTIRLHEKAPFGVLRLKAELKAQKDGQDRGTMNMTMTLDDYGTGVKSALPEAK